MGQLGAGESLFDYNMKEYTGSQVWGNWDLEIRTFRGLSMLEFEPDSCYE